MTSSNFNVLEKIYGPRHQAKDEMGGGSSGFEKERVKKFTLWIGGDKKILDLGCRDGRIARHLLTAGNQVIGFDVDKRALDRCPAGMITEQRDLNSDWHLGQENKYDVVVISEVIEHLYYPDQVFVKIASVLKPGGWLIGSVPNAFNIKNRLRLLLARPNNTPLGEPTHINHFSYRILLRLLRRCFSGITIGAISRPQWQLLANVFPGATGSLLVFRAQKR